MGVISSQGDAPGIPAIDRTTCTVCAACAETCPSGLFEKRGRAIVIDHGTTFGCVACGQCMMVCPSGSVTVTGRKLRPADLVELPPKKRRATPEQLEALMLARRSVRKFRKDDVPRELLDRVVTAAATAPMGIPPWEVGVVVFHGRDKVRELAFDAADLYAGLLKLVDNPIATTLARPFLSRATWEQLTSFILPLGRELAAGRKQGVDYALYGAPAALLFHVSPYADAADAFIACTYAMLAAGALGLGTTMIGCVSPPLARKKDLLRKYGLPEGHLPKIVLILGWPATHYRKAIRRSFASVRYY